MKIQQLLSFIPYFESIDPDEACRWKPSVKREDGVIEIGYPIYSAEFKKFINTVHDSEFLVKDYVTELDRLVPNWQSVNIQEIIETADLHLVLVVLTKLIRVERFSDGAWDSATRNGLFLAILRRLNDLHRVRGDKDHASI